jgi:hypothetical protein
MYHLVADSRKLQKQTELVTVDLCCNASIYDFGQPIDQILESRIYLLINSKSLRSIPYKPDIEKLAQINELLICQKEKKTN